MQDTLKMSSYADMQDWMDRDSKLPPVILNDKLMTDAIIGGTGMPIKTEHSYSLNSDGDSISDTLPDSPHSLQNKMDGRWIDILRFGMFFVKSIAVGFETWDFSEN